MYYIILAPDNKKIIQAKVDSDVKKSLNFDINSLNVNNSEELTKQLEKHPLLAKMALDYIQNSESPDLKNTGYRYYLQQLDEAMINENNIRRYAVTILIFIFFLLLFIFVLYGRYIINVPFNLKQIGTSISITFILIACMQLYFVYIVTPKLKMVNDKSIQKALYAFMLGKPLELPKVPQN
jgi:magnesium-transporting ATPase (P-type)